MGKKETKLIFVKRIENYECSSKNVLNYVYHNNKRFQKYYTIISQWITGKKIKL